MKNKIVEKENPFIAQLPQPMRWRFQMKKFSGESDTGAIIRLIAKNNLFSVVLSKYLKQYEKLSLRKV